MTKKRLDVLLVERGLAESRARAEALVLAGRVTVAGRDRVKPGTPVDEHAEVAVGEKDHPWVSRGGLKLAHGLAYFGLDVKDKVCLDVGASTGGFTDVLLAHGAARVYAVDVGWGQLHARLRSDPRVLLRERVNARFLSRAEVPEAPSVLVADVSFISLTLVLPAAVALLAPGADVLVLVKPQFEAGRKDVGRGGIVRDESVRARAVARIADAAARLGLVARGVVPSPIEGADGNVEYLAAFRANPAKLSG